MCVLLSLYGKCISMYPDSLALIQQACETLRTKYIHSKQFHIVTTLQQHDVFVVTTLQSNVVTTKICRLPD